MYQLPYSSLNSIKQCLQDDKSNFITIKLAKTCINLVKAKNHLTFIKFCFSSKIIPNFISNTLHINGFNNIAIKHRHLT